MSDKDYTLFVLEDVQGKFDILLEGQAAMAPIPAKIEAIEERLTSIESILAVTQLSVLDHEVLLKNHEIRIVNLEVA